MQGNESLRQYLQYHANNHPSAAKRAEAQALLNKVGDDGKLDGNFLTGQRGGFLELVSKHQTDILPQLLTEIFFHGGLTRITAGGVVKGTIQTLPLKTQAEAAVVVVSTHSLLKKLETRQTLSLNTMTRLTKLTQLLTV